jgi:hypothetical protein
VSSVILPDGTQPLSAGFNRLVPSGGALNHRPGGPVRRDLIIPDDRAAEGVEMPADNIGDEYDLALPGNNAANRYKGTCRSGWVRPE